MRPRRRERLHRALDFALSVLSLLVLPAILLGELADSPLETLSAATLDWVIWIGFTAGLAAIFVVMHDRRKFLSAHALDLLLVVATPPFFPWQALRVLRSLRLLRLLLVSFRLHRHARELTRASVLGPAAVLVVVVVVSAATAVHQLEPSAAPTVNASLWWALSRVSAMGDGGVHLQTVWGRGVELLVAISGLAFLSLLTAAVATLFVRNQRSDDNAEALADVRRRLERIEQRSEGQSRPRRDDRP